MARPDPDSLARLSREIARFVRERDWEKWHNPKNLSMSVAIEAAELMEHFQWLTPAASARKARGPEREAVQDEVADVAIFAIRLSQVLRFNLGRAILRKLEKNARKYPAHLVKGSARKYTHYRKPARPADAR